MAVLVQQNEGITSASVTSFGLTFTSANAQGNALIVLVQGSNFTVPTLADGAGNAYTLVANGNADGSYGLYFFAAMACVAHTGNTVTATFGTTQSYIIIVVSEWARAACGAFDQQSFAAGTTSTTPTGAAITTHAPGALVVAVCQYNSTGTCTVGSGFTLADGIAGQVIEFEVLGGAWNGHCELHTFEQWDRMGRLEHYVSPAANRTGPSRLRLLSIS